MERRPPRDLAPIVFACTGVLISGLFLFILLILINPAMPRTPQVDPAFASNIDRILISLSTRRSILVYEILLAGMIGAYISQIQPGVSEGTSKGETWPPQPQKLVLLLLLGAAASITVGVLAPLVIVGRSDGPGINRWVLVTAGAIAGYRSRGALANLETTLSRLLETMSPRFDTKTLEKSVKASVHEALALPKLTQYRGHFEIAIINSSETISAEAVGSGFSIRGEQPMHLIEKTKYFLIVRLGPNVGPSEVPDPEREQKLRSVKFIDIPGDERPNSAPFRFLVDFGFDDIPPIEDTVDVPRNQPFTRQFEFVAPEKKVDGSDRMSWEVETTDPVQPREVAVSLYQKSRYCGTCSIPVELR